MNNYIYYLIILLSFPHVLCGQSNSIDIGDDTERVYSGQNKLLNLGTSYQQGGLAGSEVIFDIVEQRLVPQQVGDNYIFNTTLSGKSGVVDGKVGCAIYVYSSNGDSVEISDFEFKFSRNKYTTLQNQSVFYTTDTFAANYGEVHCNFGDSTWINNTEFHIAKVVDVRPVSIAHKSLSVDLTLTNGIDIDLQMTQNERADPNWVLDPTLAKATYLGQPNYVDIRLNVRLFIADNINNQRPNFVAEIVRENDNKVIGPTANTYIRDSNDHEESSWNIAVVDTNPLLNSIYKVRYYRETGGTGLVQLASIGSGFTLIAHK